MDLKYKLVGNKAFTEDKILVYNIRICVYNDKLTLEQIREYFQNFGEILEARFTEYKSRIEKVVITGLSPCDFLNYQRRENTYYIVRFSNPEAAASALRTPFHEFNNCRIEVDACGSSDQPDGQKIIEQITKTVENKSIPQNADFRTGCNKTIENLNDDCLKHIYNYLALGDQINFALTCQRVCYLFAKLSKVKHKHVDYQILESLTQFESRVFLQIVGPQIIKFSGNFSFFTFEMDKEDATVELLGMYLTNVENLKIIQNKHHSLSKLIKKMQKLQELELIRCVCNDSFIKYLKRYKNLKVLKMIMTEIEGSEIPNLTGLTKLMMYHCENVYPNLKNIFKSLINLTYLDLKCETCDDQLQTEDYKAIANHLKQLTTLKITLNTGNFNCLAQLPHLKILEIRANVKNIPPLHPFLKKLAKFQANQLEELSIFTDVVNSEGADSIVKLKNLKVLKCNFFVDDANLEKFTQLNNLQNIVLHHTEFGDDGILKLLRNCRDLRRISLRCPIDEKSNLITRVRQLLQEQHDLGHRVDPLYFVFTRPLSDTDKKLTKCESSDVLKIIVEPEDKNKSDYEYCSDFDLTDYANHDDSD